MLSIRCDGRVRLWRNKKDPQRIAKIKSFIDKYNQQEINYPPEKDG